MEDAILSNFHKLLILLPTKSLKGYKQENFRI